jgi:aminopeptidase-like protein
MVGSETPLSLQQSFTGQTIMDEVAEAALREVQPVLRVGPFRSIVGNDETVWEAPGIEVPMISISRFPYDQYHTSNDNATIMSPARLNESLDVLKRIVQMLEEDLVIHRKFQGLIALSNPRYKLYRERPDPVVQKNISESDLKLGSVQDILPRYFDGSLTIFQLARKFGLSFDTLKKYLLEFEAKGLVELRPPASLDHYPHPAPPVISPKARRTPRRRG